MDIEQIKNAINNFMPEPYMHDLLGMIAENARLRAEIDAANAQEPIYQMYSESRGWVDMCEQSYANNTRAGNKTRKVYACPIPAQQSPEPRGTNEYGLDIGYMAEKLNLFLRDIDRHTTDEAARVLARLAMVADQSVLHEPEFSERIRAGMWLELKAQQSPAVEVPNGWRIVEKKTCYALINGNEVIATLAGAQAEENAAIIAKLLSSPRITESAVAVPDSAYDWNPILESYVIKRDMLSPRITEQYDKLPGLVVQELYSNGGPHESQLDEARRIIAFIASRLPQRVTEQDALDILGDYFGFCLESRLKATSPTVTSMWVNKRFPSLLKKLNKVTHETN